MIRAGLNRPRISASKNQRNKEVSSFKLHYKSINAIINKHHNIHDSYNGDKNKKKKGTTESVQNIAFQKKQTRKISNRNRKHERPKCTPSGKG